MFYYVYGILHSPDYRERYVVNLSRELPHIPRVKSLEDFRVFCEAGRRLADLHRNFETAEPYPVDFIKGKDVLLTDPEAHYRVVKIKLDTKSLERKPARLIYNEHIAFSFPREALEYRLGGKPAIKWIADYQSVKKDVKTEKGVNKGSGIISDANRYAIETVGDPAYILNLLRRVITISLETRKIIKALPALDIMESP